MTLMGVGLKFNVLACNAKLKLELKLIFLSFITCRMRTVV